VKYTTVMSVAQNGKFTPMSTTVTWLKDGLERLDTKLDNGFFKSNETTITSAAKRNSITFDPALKIYVVEAFGADGRPAGASMGSSGARTSSGGKGTGKIVMTVGAKFLGLEKLMDYQTRHNITTTTMDSSGCCGTGQSKYKTEDWRADVKLPTLAYPHDPNQSYGYGGGADGGNCKISFERKGDVAAYEAAQKGLALKTLMFDGQTGKVVTSMQITMLSFAALDDPSFVPPTGFKQVSRAEYDKKKQAAMTAEIMKNAQQAAKNGGAMPSPDESMPAEPMPADMPATDEAVPATEAQPAAAPEAGDMGKEAAKGVGKGKLKKKFKLPF
jgi:hypothetical protein